MHPLRHRFAALLVFQFFAVGLFAAPYSPRVASTNGRTVVFRVVVPEVSGTVYLTGNRPELGPWSPGKFALTGTGRERTGVLDVPAGTYLEFKFTGGSWATVETTAAGADIPNRTYTVPADGEAVHRNRGGLASALVRREKIHRHRLGLAVEHQL